MATGVWLVALRPPGDDVIMTVADVMMRLVVGWMQRLVCVVSLTAVSRATSAGRNTPVSV